MEKGWPEARRAKDKAFDGQFFFAVSTTGIFCRPSCPAPVAKEENVTYYSSLFQALEAGYRPCLRCKPDLELDYTTQNPRGHIIVRQALELIYDGFLQESSLVELAEKLNISDRYLRKCFSDNLGVPPVKVARYHRAVFAKQLLLSSSLAVSDIAYGAGFGSLRQFNQTFGELFGLNPTEMRGAMKRGKDGLSSCRTQLYLKYQKPFHFAEILSFLRLRAIKGVEHVDEQSYSRTFQKDGSTGYFTVHDIPHKSSLKLTVVTDNLRLLMFIYNRVKRMFDLDADRREIGEFLSRDPLLQKQMDNDLAPALPRAFDSYEFVVRAILGQQITVKAATTLAGRIAAQSGEPTGDTFPQELRYCFPTPAQLINGNLQGLGLTKTRKQTVLRVTEALIAGSFSIADGQDYEQFAREFSAIKGIGDWTVNYVAMRGLGFVDAFPATDLGIIKALTVNEQQLSTKDIVTRAENWRPYRAYATLCLWKSLGGI